MMRYCCFFIFFLLNVSRFYGQQDENIATSNVDSVFFKLKKELSTALENNNDSLAVIKYIEFADFYKNNGAVNEAILNYQKALSYPSPKADTLVVYLNLQLGAINFSVKQFSAAKTYYFEALHISESINYIKGNALAESALGSCFEKQQNYEKALLHQNKSLNLFERLEDYNGLALVNENIGSIYEDKLDFKLAYQYFKKALSYIVLTEDFDRQINILNNLGDSKRKVGDFSEALVYTLKAKNLALETNNSHQLESSYKDLSKHYNLINDFEKAYRSLQISDSIRDQILKSQNTQQVNSLQALYDAKNKQAKIELLTKEKEVAKVEELLLLLVIIILIVVAVIVFIYHKKKKENELISQRYKQQILEADLEKKKIQEENLQREIALKTTSLSQYSLHLAHKNKILTQVANTLSNLKGRKQMDVQSKLTAIVAEINSELSEKQEWEQFMGYFQQIHPSFFDRLKEYTIEELSPSELRLCMLLKLNLSSKEVASILRITPDSIRVARYRLRKKLKIDSGEKLTRFLHQL
ncbi:tetratricopeptide repeat protein [Joostella atrarenae]|uniref:Tetratricopeptide repeat protein n=1 Tax=Joostella atrarenae TaxID=679257 RepID=A0ABS9IYI3_9FLAO|nr:tetratricopeptide repeat protein [Joostella atrarenae]MCF8713239.1 tetratricopeptide repeat protein [Joostella atrarenae]